MSGKNRRGAMIRKSCWGALASMFLAIAFLTGCSSTPQTPNPTQLVTITPNTPIVQNTTLNAAFSSVLSATVMSNGAPVVGATVTFSAPGSGAGGTFPGGNSTGTGTTNASGIATSPTFTANGTAGTYNVIASTASTQATALFSLSNTYQPEAISVAGGTPQSTSASTQFASVLSVTVKNGTQAVGSGLPVTFTAPDGMFTDTDLPTSTVLTNSSGVATSAPYVASAVVGGQYSVVASTIDGDAATATFTLSNTITPAVITASGASTPQSTTAGSPFATALSVTVVDGSTPPVPVSNALVTFTAPSFTLSSATPPVPSASSGTFADTGTVTTNVWTDASGVATAPTFTANTLAGGPYNVTATVVVKSGTTLSTTFSLTNN
jgi:hypothetical protein